MHATASTLRRALAALCAFAAVAAALLGAPAASAQTDDETTPTTSSSTTTTVPAPVYRTVTEVHAVHTNHVHRTLDDDPPAKLEAYNHRYVVTGRRFVSATHFNQFRRNTNNAYRETFCPATEAQFWSGNFNCTPGHSLAGYTYRGHRTDPIFQDIVELRYDKRIVPVNHLHTRYEPRTSTICVANCDRVPPGSTVPPTTAPSTSLPPVPLPPRPSADALLVNVNAFRHGQTGGSLAAPQQVSVSADALTCDDGTPAPCGAAPGDGAAGVYGPFPESLTLDELEITAPAGFREGRGGARHDWWLERDAVLGANLWSPLYDAVRDSPRLQFYRATDPGTEFRVRAKVTATVRFVEWYCLGGLTSCPDPADRVESDVEQTLTDVQVRYRPNQRGDHGYFKVIGPTVRR